MKILEKKLDCYLLETYRMIDNRGWFRVDFSIEELSTLGLDFEQVFQINHSLTEQGGVIRGLNYQEAPYSQAKVVRCLRGSIYSVAVDITKDSKTFGQWCGFDLVGEDSKWMYIPRGYAHGFLTKEDNTKIEYITDNKYSQSSAKSIRFDDPDINIDWSNGNIMLRLDLLSDKNLNAPFLNDKGE